MKIRRLSVATFPMLPKIPKIPRIAMLPKIAMMFLSIPGLSGPAHAGGLQPAGGQEVHWVLTQGECDPVNGSTAQTTVRCGGYGDLVFSSGPIQAGKCPISASGSEVPALYSALDGPPERSDPLAVPCIDRSCFGRTGNPWVAVVDWDDPHGWSVGEVIHQLSDERADVVLFSFDEQTTRLPLGYDDVGDAHVLTALCAVAEEVETAPADPPALINLSFGRLPASFTPATCPPAGGSSLACQIEGVLEHLAVDLDLPIVAAAGNHGEDLFPAQSDHVLAVGTLNLDRFDKFGEAVRGWTTPDGVKSVMPGYGLYLRSPYDEHPFWTLPAGSSYAAAVASGWIAGTLAADGPTPGEPVGKGHEAVVVPFAERVWLPKFEHDRLVLEADGETVAGSDLEAVRAFVDRSLGSTPAACVNSPFIGPSQAQISHSVLEIGVISLARYGVGLSHPQPGARPCLPCHGGGTTGGGGQPLASIESDVLTVDLSEGEPLAEAITAVTGVFLQIGSSLYTLDHFLEPDLLDDLRTGSVRTLEISGALPLYSPGEEIVLIVTMEIDGVEVWDATPIALHSH